ncbi:MAG TPA: nucleoside-diphosphate kinase [Candidatus Latescibacteria bacterium]|nr:nucleoside-diphosphate kinase [Candidatus Latescibacterota bacterium]
MQKTLVLLKPDAVQRGLVGELISRLERKGLKLVGMKMLRVDEQLARRHYSAHVGKPFFDGLIAFITSGPLVAMVAEGAQAVNVVRSIMGATDPQDAGPGTVRGDFAISIGPNLIHGSDSAESAEREIDLFFSPNELVDYTRDIDQWITES